MNKSRKKEIILLLILLSVVFSASGCGETISGIAKDFKRIGKGVQTIFVKQK